MIDAALDRVEEELGERHVRVRADRRRHPHRDRTARHRDRRRRPAPSCTPAAAATTRSRSTCGCTCAARVVAQMRAHPRAARGARSGARTRRPTSYLPGYTHLQRAQPVLLAHHLLAHFWALGRDVDRWRDCLERADVSPLGAGALAGSSLPLDPSFVAERARLRRPRSRTRSTRSPIATSSPRRCSSRRSRRCTSRGIGEEIVLWSTEEFGFVRLADAFSTGSSMLPQKKNPDIAELARGKAGRLIGDLTGFLATLEGPAARVQPRPAGGQGAAVRRARHVRAVAGRADRPDRDGRVRRGHA